MAQIIIKLIGLLDIFYVSFVRRRKNCKPAGSLHGIPSYCAVRYCALIISATIGWFLFTNIVYADTIDLSIISQIESSNNPDAISRVGQNRIDIGLYQISPDVLKEYNQYNHTRYTSKDLFNPYINKQIASWYINQRIPAMLRHFRKPITTENIIICYNAGISYVAHNKSIPKETINYIKKYNQRKGE